MDKTINYIFFRKEWQFFIILTILIFFISGWLLTFFYPPEMFLPEAREMYAFNRGKYIGYILIFVWLNWLAWRKAIIKKFNLFKKK